MAKVTFIGRDGLAREVEAPLGETLLEIAHMHKIALEGACDHSLACATCHVIVDANWVEVLNTPSRDELDMLDLAMGVAKTSRLACQITMREEFDGLVVQLGPI